MPCFAASSASFASRAAHEDRLDLHAGHAVGEEHAALLSDREDRAHEVLPIAHAARDAVHDDADGGLVALGGLRGGLRGGLLCHGVSCSSRERVAMIAAPLRESVYPSVGHDGRIAQHPVRGAYPAAVPSGPVSTVAVRECRLLRRVGDLGGVQAPGFARIAHSHDGSARDFGARTHFPGNLSATLQELPRDAPVGCRVRPARRGELPASARACVVRGCRGRAGPAPTTRGVRHRA